VGEHAPLQRRKSAMWRSEANYSCFGIALLCFFAWALLLTVD
jgi:hypothetical protein